jgi:hypothetical protein
VIPLLINEKNGSLQSKRQYLRQTIEKKMEKVQKFPKEYLLHSPDIHLKKGTLADLFPIIIILGTRREHAKDIAEMKINNCYKCYFLTFSQRFYFDDKIKNVYSLK